MNLAQKQYHKIVCSLAVMFCILYPVISSAEDCFCNIKNASPTLTINGKPIQNNSQIACGTVITATQSGELTLANELIIDFEPGTSLELPPVLCDKTGSIQAKNINGIIELVLPEKITTSLAETIPAGFRTIEKTNDALGVVIRTEGKAVIQAKNKPDIPLLKDSFIYHQETIKTDKNGFVQLRLSNGKIIFIGENQEFTLNNNQ